MKKYIEKLALPGLLVLGAVSVSVAEVLTSSSGKTIKIENETSGKQGIVGVRFDATQNFSGFASWGSPQVIKENYDGVQLYEFRALKAWDVSPIDAGPKGTFSGEATGGAWDDVIAASKYLEPLYSTGVCDQPEDFVNADPITIDELEVIIKNSNYYDATYRYPKPDAFGTKGGQFSGGFIDTYNNETQMIFAMPTGNVHFAQSSDYPWLDSEIGTMAFMATSMGQEFFGVDQQWVFSVGAKETFLGSTYHTVGKNTNAEGAFGPWEVEDVTFMSRAMGYPKFFPYEPCLLDPGARDVASASGVCGTTPLAFAGKYMNEPTSNTTPLDHPKIVSAWYASAFTFWFNYDLLANASDLGFKNALLESTDPLIGLCIMTPLYNLGINSGAEAQLKSAIQGASSGITCNDFPTGNSNYRPNIMKIGQKFLDAAIAVHNDKSATNPQILDRWITLSDIREFYFGKGADVSEPWKTDGATQDGGLMHHFNIGETEAEKMWKELVEAFELQEKHWGGGKISLRYDWISNLRIAKQYLDVNRGQIKGEEAGQWIETRSTIPGGVDGNPLDKRFPFVTHSTTEEDANTEDLVVTFETNDNRTDDRGVKTLEWTTKENWTLWSTQGVKALGADPKDMDYEVRFDKTQIDKFKEEIEADGLVKNLYVRVSDDCGNAVVTKVENFVKVVPPVTPNLPELKSAFVSDKDGDGEADQLTVFANEYTPDSTEVADVLLSSGAILWHNWPDKSGSLVQVTSSYNSTNSNFVYDGAMSGGSGTGNVEISWSTGEKIKGVDIADSVGPVIKSAYFLVDSPNELVVNFSENIRGLEREPALDYFMNHSVANQGVMMADSARQTGASWTFYFSNSLEPFEGDSINIDFRSVDSRSFIKDVPGNSAHPTNKGVKILKYTGPAGIDKEGSRYEDSDLDGTMDRVVIRFTRSLDASLVGLNIRWKDTTDAIVSFELSNLEVSTVNPQELIANLSNPNVLSAEKFASLAKYTTYFDLAESNWGEAIVTQPVPGESDDIQNVTMFDKMEPMIKTAELVKTSSPDSRPDKLRLNFSEPLETSKIKSDVNLFVYDRNKIKAALPQGDNLNWRGVDDDFLIIEFMPGDGAIAPMERPAIGDFVRINEGITDLGYIQDKSDNFASVNNPFQLITGKQIIQFQCPNLVGSDDEKVIAIEDKFLTPYFADNSENLDVVVKDSSWAGVGFTFSFKDSLATVAERKQVEVNWGIQIFDTRGQFVISETGSFGCEDIEARRDEGDLSRACDPLFVSGSREIKAFVPWNFRAQDNRLVGSGVYIIKAEAWSEKEGKTLLSKDEYECKEGVVRGTLD